MEKTIQGSLGAVSAFQLTEDMDALDKQSKKILQYREVLAIILKETVEEYQGYYISTTSKRIQRKTVQIHKF